MKIITVITAAVLFSSTASAQDSQFSETTTADLMQELEFVSQLKQDIPFNSPQYNAAMYAFARFGHCNEMTLEETEELAKPFAIITSAYSGGLFEGEIEPSLWRRVANGACYDDEDYLADHIVLLDQIAYQFRVRDALDIRRKEMVSRVLPETEISQWASELMLSLTKLDTVPER